MTTVNHETGEIVVSYGEVRASVEKARASGTTFFEQVVWQIENQAWSVLGYSDWDEMRDAEYGDMGVVVPRADRPEIVSRLRRTGMTQKEIAETVGVDVATVSRDLANASSDVDVTITNSRGQERPANYTKPAPKMSATDFAVATQHLTDDEFSQAIAETRSKGEVTTDAVVRHLPEPKPTPVVLTDSSADYDNAEKASKSLSNAIAKLLEFQHPNMREAMRRYWSMASNEVPPTPRRDVSPEQMRVAAQGLLALADEWSSK